MAVEITVEDKGPSTGLAVAADGILWEVASEKEKTTQVLSAVENDQTCGRAQVTMVT